MKKPKIWAHRGASGYLPENTLPAFAKAIELGADGIELDIHKTKDGKMVVIHDEQIDRTSNGTGWIKDMTLEELRTFTYNKTHPECENVTIPTMREVFELVKPSNLMINIELKTGLVFYEGIEEDIIKMVAEYGMEDRIIYSSFNHYSVLKVKELNPQAKIGFLYMDGPIDMPGYGKKYGVNALHPDYCNLKYENFSEDCKKYGLDINVWTVNTEEQVKGCVEAGAHALITNYPDKIDEYLSAYKWD